MKSVVVMGVMLLSALAANAQRYDLYFGYDFTRFNPNSNLWPSFNANGGTGQFSYNFNKWLAGVIDMGAVNTGVLNGFNIDHTVANLLAGPRFTKHFGRWQPFGQVLFGGVYSTSSAGIGVLGGQIVPPPGVTNPIAPVPPIPVTPNVPLAVRFVNSSGGFGMMAGGGLDIKISKHVAFRPLGVDYFLTRLPDPFLASARTNRNNFRYTTGFRFDWGREK